MTSVTFIYWCNYSYLPPFLTLKPFHFSGNIIALLHFQGHRKDLPTILYILIVIVDIFSCSTCLPIAVCYLNDRQPMWFGNTVFCHAWGILWAIIPFLSVFLVAVLSITRTISLINPLRKINMNQVFVVVAMYTSYLILWSFVPIIFKYGQFVYTASDTYCWEDTRSGWYSNLEITNGAALLAFPIIPIIISCIISTRCVLSSLRVSSLSLAVRSIKIDATITIILITTTYIILNLPIFIIWVLYIHDNFTVRDNVFSKYYSWSSCYVICVTVNATLNPFIYMARMKKFRISFLEKFSLVRRKTASNSSSNKLSARNIKPFLGVEINRQSMKNVKLNSIQSLSEDKILWN